VSTHLPTVSPASGPLRLARPEWLKVRASTTGEYEEVRAMMRRLSLVTVCEEARCPNIHECWARERTATFMLMGDVCTRHCGFCAVGKGRPGSLDPEEPSRVAEAAAELSLSHVVVTSVNRDDLPDGGAGHFAATIEAIRRRLPEARTVPRLYRRVRPDARYAQSLELLARADSLRRETGSAWKTKSGLMVGLGEGEGEVLETLRDLRAVSCDIVTIGQYLQPYEKRLPVERYYTPEEFDRLRAAGEALGFFRVEAGPLVRSSYHARRALAS